MNTGLKDEPGFAAQEGQAPTPAHVQIFQAAEMLKGVNEEFIGEFHIRFPSLLLLDASTPSIPFLRR